MQIIKNINSKVELLKQRLDSLLTEKNYVGVTTPTMNIMKTKYIKHQKMTNEEKHGSILKALNELNLKDNEGKQVMFTSEYVQELFNKTKGDPYEEEKICIKNLKKKL